MNKIDWIVLITITILVLAFKANTFNDPYYWDDMGGVVAPALDMYDHDFRIIHPTRNFGHPPLQPLTLVVIWKLFGISLTVSHLYILIIGIIGLFFTYQLGKILFNSTFTAVTGALLLFTNQLFFAQLGLLNDSIPLLTLGVLTIYFYWRHRPILYIIFATLLVLTKETGAILIISIFFYQISLALFQTSNHNFKKIYFTTIKSLYLLTPLLFLTLWFCYHKMRLGWWLRSDLIICKNTFLDYLFFNLSRFLIIDRSTDSITKTNFLWIGTIIIASWLKRKLNWHWLFLTAIVIVCYIGLFSYTTSLARYYTPLLPFIALAVANAIHKIFENLLPAIKYSLTVAIILIPALFYAGPRATTGERLESNLEYRDAIDVSRQAVKYLDEIYPTSTVITYWPMSDQLADVRYGYTALSGRSIVDITYMNRMEEYIIGQHILNYEQLKKLSNHLFYAASFNNNLLIRRLLDDNLLEIVQIFSKNNKQTTIYKLKTPLLNYDN